MDNIRKKVLTGLVVASIPWITGELFIKLKKTVSGSLFMLVKAVDKAMYLQKQTNHHTY